MAQLTYGDMIAGQAGQRVDMTQGRVRSFAAEGAIPFGRGVVAGTGDDQCTLPTSASDRFLGVSMFTHAAEQDATGFAQYLDTSTVSVETESPIWMESVATVVAGESAYVIVTAGDDQGKITNSATGTIGPVGKFESAGGDGDLVSVLIDAKGA